VAEFCYFLRAQGRIRGDFPVRFAGHAYQLYERVVPRLYDEAVMLVGDAAGLAYPQSGEGIRPAVESGILAAEVALQTGPAATGEELSVYQDRIRARFGKPRSDALSGWLPAGWLPASWLQFVASRLLASRWFARRVVMDRWFLHRSEPALQTATHV
jgi:menaquinone-9 beta-reductase